MRQFDGGKKYKNTHKKAAFSDGIEQKGEDLIKLQYYFVCTIIIICLTIYSCNLEQPGLESKLSDSGKNKSKQKRRCSRASLVPNGPPFACCNLEARAREMC